MATYKLKINDNDVELDDAQMEEFISGYKSNLDTSKMSAAQKKAIDQGLNNLKSYASDSVITNDNGILSVEGPTSTYFSDKGKEDKRSDKYARQHAINALNSLYTWAGEKQQPKKEVVVSTNEKVEKTPEPIVDDLEKRKQDRFNAYKANRNLITFGSQGATDAEAYYKNALSNYNLLGNKNSREDLFKSYINLLMDNELSEDSEFGDSVKYDKAKVIELKNRYDQSTDDNEKNELLSAIFTLTGDIDAFNTINNAPLSSYQPKEEKEETNNNTLEGLVENNMLPISEIEPEKKQFTQDELNSIIQTRIIDSKPLTNSGLAEIDGDFKMSDVFEMYKGSGSNPVEIVDISRDLNLPDKKVYVVTDKEGNARIIARDNKTGEVGFILEANETGEEVKSQTKRGLEGVVSSMIDLTEGLSPKYDDVEYPYRRQKGGMVFKVRKPNEPSYKVKPSIDDNIKFSDMKSDKLSTEDMVEIGAAIGDLTSIATSFVPGVGSAASLGIGAISDATRLGAKLSRGDNTVESLKDFGKDLLITGASAIPGLAVGKLAKVAPRIAKFVPAIMAGIQSSAMKEQFAETATKLAQGKFDELGTEDVKNMLSMLNVAKGFGMTKGFKTTKSNTKAIGTKADGTEVKLTDDQFNAVNSIKGRSDRLKKLKEMVGDDVKLSVGLKSTPYIGRVIPNRFNMVSKIGSNVYDTNAKGFLSKPVHKQIKYSNKGIIFNQEGNKIPVINFSTEYLDKINQFKNKQSLETNKLLGLKLNQPKTEVEGINEVKNPLIAAKNEAAGLASAALNGITSTDAMIAYNALMANKNTDKLKRFTKINTALRTPTLKPIQSVGYDIHKENAYKQAASNLQNQDVNTSDLGYYLRSRNAQNAQATNLLNQSEAEKSSELRASKAAQEQALYENQGMRNETDFYNKQALAQAANQERQQLGNLENRKLQNAQALREFFANKAMQREQKEDYLKTIEDQYGVLANDNEVEDIDAELSQATSSMNTDQLNEFMRSDKYRELIRKRNIADKNRQLSLARAQAGLGAKPYNIGGRK